MRPAARFTLPPDQPHLSVDQLARLAHVALLRVRVLVRQYGRVELPAHTVQQNSDWYSTPFRELVFSCEGQRELPTESEVADKFQPKTDLDREGPVRPCG